MLIEPFAADAPPVRRYARSLVFQCRRTVKASSIRKWILLSAWIAAEVAHFDEKKLAEYEEEIMREYDYHSRMAYADHKGEERGLAKGLANGLAKTAINLKAMGMSFEFILHATGLTEDELKKILS